MAESMTSAQEAAAMWGSAGNAAYSVADRLVFALQALEFFGNEYDRLRTLSVEAPVALYGAEGREPICDFDCDYCRQEDSDDQ